MSNKNKKIVAIFSILAIVSFSGGMLLSKFKGSIGKIKVFSINKSNIGVNNDLDEKYGDFENIALLGVDSVDNTGRSDSIMILTLDKKDKKLKLTSLMRDSYVNIEGHGKDKLNHAYAFGGPELAIKTINENFDLNIKDFITVNFASLPKVIDSIGGLEIDVDSEELKYINKYIDDLNKKNKTSYSKITKTGLQHLNGTQTMAYCRIRYTSGGDYKRTERHREVLEALIKKGMSLSPLKYPALLDKVLPMLETSLSTSEIVSLATQGAKLGGNLEQDRFPKDEHSQSIMIEKIYYLKYKEKDTIEALHKWIFEQ